MNLPVRLWLRRSSAAMTFPAMIGIAALAIGSRSGWYWERGQAASWASSTTMILGPLAAGAVAFDMWRRMTPTMRELAASASRGSRGVLAVAGATWLLTVCAWALGVGAALVVAAQHGAAGAPSWWVLAQAPAALLAACFFGAMVGSLLRSVAAAPVAAVAFYLIPIGMTWFGAQGLMMAGGATAPLIGIEPDPTIGATILVIDILIAALCALVVARRSTVVSTVSTGVTAAVVTVLVFAVGAFAAMDPMLRSYRPSATPTFCAGAKPQVCGPEEGRALYEIAADDLDRARQVLLERGIAIGSRYDYPRGDVPLPTRGVGMLSLTPTDIEDGRLAVWDVALTVATPAACEQYYGASPPTELLDGQGRFATWLMDQLDGSGGDDAEDVSAARATYRALQHCSGEDVPSWTYGQ